MGFSLVHVHCYMFVSDHGPNKAFLLPPPPPRLRLLLRLKHTKRRSETLTCSSLHGFQFFPIHHALTWVPDSVHDVQIEIFKITHGIEGLDSGMLFKYKTDNRTREQSWALAKERCKLDIRKYACSQRTD